MSHWISSKLKAAESILQQIDQQAADSLRKNDKPQPDDDGLRIPPKNPEDNKPLIKDQLRKKTPENVANLTIDYGNKRNENVFSRSNSDISRDNEAKVSGSPRVSVSSNVEGKSSSVSGLTESDWTELLSAPDKSGGSGGGTVNRNSSVLGIRGLKKDGKVGPGLNLTAVDGKNGKGRDNAVQNSLRIPKNELEKNADSNARASNASDLTSTTVSVLSPSSGSELDRRDTGSILPAYDNNDVTSIGIPEMNGIIDKEKLLTAEKRKYDMRARSSDMERLKNGASRSNELSTKNAPSSSGSEEESNSETDSASSSDSEIEREREERRKRRQQILAEKAAAKAVEAIKERENLVAKLEGEKQSLEKILEERAKQQVQEASELQTTMMETMEAVDLEKQKHNNTRMEAFSRLAKLESANAELTRSLANVQKNFQVEVDRVAELRQRIHMKEATQEELRRKISIAHRSGDKLLASKGVEFELEMLEADCSLISDKVGRMQEKGKMLETSIEQTRREIESPTEVEIELKRRLAQLTDHLIQKQAQVESLSSEKATLHFRTEAVSRLLNENNTMSDSANYPGTSLRDDTETGSWQLSNSNLKPFIKERMQSGQQHLGSLVRQLDSLYCTGAVFLRRNSTARIWGVVYIVCLHLWVMYILMSHSPVPEDNGSGAAFSLENVNNTGSM